MNFDNDCMKQALEQALYASSSKEVPVGAVIVNRLTRHILSKTHNMVESDNNPLHHAEILAINHACKILHSKNLSECDIYITLEPCAMCAAAIAHAKIGRIFYGASDIKSGAIENGVRFFTHSTCHHHPDIYIGILAQESETLLRDFFHTLRA